MSDTPLVSTGLKPTGDRLLTPPLGDPAQFSYRVVLEGVFTFAYSGEQFDALYRSGPDGPFSRRHTFLHWSTRAPVLISEDREHHRYVFSIPREWKMEGQSLGVGVDVDQFVNEYLIAPSEVRSALSGEIGVTALQTPLVVPFPWHVVAWSALPTAAALGGIAVILRRRMLLSGLAEDLQEAAVRIERKYRAARAAVRSKTGGAFAVGDRLAAVREGAGGLIRQIQSLRNTQRLADRRALEQQSAALEKRLATLTDGAARREGETVLAEKRKTLALLDEVEQAESRCTMRLAKIEAVLDSASLTLRSVRLESASAPAEETLRSELDAEVAAIREVAREVSVCEDLQAQVVTGR